ncbi:MAG: Pvc16 family protein [Anaerolineae bacterium]
MIADLDQTIRQLLIDELPVKNGEIDISFDQPTREWSSRISTPTLNIFLYDIRENNVLRKHQWERLNGANNAQDLAQLKRSPMRVDCSYMLTTWAADPEDEHRLLTRTMLALFRFPNLPNDRLIGNLKNPPFEIQARLARHDKLTEPSDLWNVLDNELRPTVSYVITLALDPWSVITGPLVKTRRLRLGQASELPHRRVLVPDAARQDLALIGGTIRDEAEHEPRSGVTVALKNTGYVTTTDEHGRFVLGSVSPGDYTLVAWVEEGKPAQKEIAIPTEGREYDMEV